MTNTQIRVGVVGTGMWANFVHLAVYQAHRRATIACVCDINRQSAEDAADRFGAESVVTDYEELAARDDINMIDIITPNVLHATMALAALKAGKHVMCVRPVAMSDGAAQPMRQAAGEAGGPGRRAARNGAKTKRTASASAGRTRTLTNWALKPGINMNMVPIREKIRKNPKMLSLRNSSSIGGLPRLAEGPYAVV